MRQQAYYDQYINHLIEIRTLSSPSLEDIASAEIYSTRLRENFVKIGKLAAENHEFLDNALLPLIRSKKNLTEEEASDMDIFTQKLLNAADLEDLDPPIIDMVIDRLLTDSMAKKQLLSQIRHMDIQMSNIYALMDMTNRLTEYPEISMQYRKKGFSIGEFFLSLRQHEHFLSIPDEECRELVLTNARFISAFFEDFCSNDPEMNKQELEFMDKSLAVCEDPFYPPLVPHFDWGYYRLRILVYYATTTDHYNTRGFNKKQLSRICRHTEELWKFWHEDPDRYGAFEKERYLKILLVRNRFFAGKLSDQEFLHQMLALYKQRDKTNYELSGIIENLQIPTEILCFLKDKTLSAEIKALLGDMYNNVIVYTLRMPNSGTLFSMLEFAGHFIRHFIEIPEGIPFEEMMLNLLAAMHPPTFVHSKMVAQFTACLCEHLIDMSPELFIGVCGCRDTADVKNSRYSLIKFAYNAALCHDAGKIFIIDTVFVYGRKLFDMEFSLIKTHPKMGAMILKQYPSTEAYADIALGHHKWYDNSRGYPPEFDSSKSPLKTIIDIVLAADCLDAATDTVGRSYNRGKTIEEFTKEIREGSGTHYAPWLIDLLSKEEVKTDINYLLDKGREKNYRDTYYLLKKAFNKAEGSQPSL